MTDLELPGMEDLPRLPPKPKVQYKVSISVDVTYEDDVYFDTDDDPRALLEDDEEWANREIDQAIAYGDPDIGWVNWGTIQVSHDGAKTWEVWDERAWERDREESPDW